MKQFFRQAIFYTVLIAVWVILAKTKVWPPYVFPTPTGVYDSLRAGFADHSFWIAIAVSMKRMLIGYSLSVVLGMILGSRRSQQQVPGRDRGWIAGQPAEPAEHLLASASSAVVWAHRESDPVCCRHGLAVVGDDRDGNRPPADAEDLRHGGTQLGRQRFQAVLVRAASSESSVHSVGPQAGMGVRVALADLRRNDFRQPWA